jgi:hypothetical protein
MRTRVLQAFTLLASLAAPPAGSAAPDDRAAGVAVLVELFTSEGCSSCPPADAALGRLLARPPEGVRVVALGEHVDYWDGSTWTDRFSAPIFTRRQEAYVRRLGLAGPYTPQLVVDGRVQLLGSDERAAREAIAAAARRANRPAGGAASARAVGGDATHLELEVRAEWGGPGAAAVWLALVQDRARSGVSGGENAGRTLEHVAVARSLIAVGRGTGGFLGTVRIPRAAASGADRVVVVVQDPDGGPVRAIGTGELGPSGGPLTGGQEPAVLPR